MSKRLNLSFNRINTTFQNRRIDSFVELIKPLKSATENCKNSTTINDTHALFDAVIESFSNIANRLTSTTDVENV